MRTETKQYRLQNVHMSDGTSSVVLPLATLHVTQEYMPDGLGEYIEGQSSWILSTNGVVPFGFGSQLTFESGNYQGLCYLMRDGVFRSTGPYTRATA